MTVTKLEGSAKINLVAQIKAIDNVSRNDLILAHVVAGTFSAPEGVPLLYTAPAASAFKAATAAEGRIGDTGCYICRRVPGANSQFGFSISEPTLQWVLANVEGIKAKFAEAHAAGKMPTKEQAKAIREVKAAAKQLAAA